MKEYKLEIIVFLTGAIGMGLELVAARVLSPYVGSSNIVWTSIIGIILVSMSVGYWRGGKIADKSADKNTISEILLYSAIFTSAISILETIVVNKVSAQIDNLIIAAIFCATVVFSIPSFMLAMISPIAVKIRSNDTNNIGFISGKISSLSTIGSIFGTFVMGFLLIPYIGINNINIGITFMLIAMSLLIREKKDKKYLCKTMILTCIILILIILGKYLFKEINKDILVDTDSQYSRIWVKQINTKKTTYKTLQVDRGLESYIDEKTGEMGAEYLKYYDLFEYFNKDAKSTLMIGGAAYTYPIHYLTKYNDKTIDVVEIDDKMTQIAQKEFGLDINNPKLKVFNQDGRTFLNYNKNKYDAILIDAFKGVNAPFELTTYEAMMKAKNMLNENGVVITNIISSLKGNSSKFIKYEYSTYKEVFDDIKLYKIADLYETNTQNLILIGIKGKPNIDETKKINYNELLNMQVLDFDANEKIVTDDYAPIGN